MLAQIIVHSEKATNRKDIEEGRYVCRQKDIFADNCLPYTQEANMSSHYYIGSLGEIITIIHINYR